MKIGLRSLKTGIAVTLTVTLSNWFGLGMGFFGAIASVIALQSTIADSIKRGKERLMGTIIGAIIGLIFSFPLYMIGSISSGWAVIANNQKPLWVGIGVIGVIVVSNMLKWKDSIVLGSIVFCAIMLNNETEQGVIIYSLYRFLETFIGIICAIGVNYFIKPPKIDKRVTETIFPLGKELFDLFRYSIVGYFYGGVTEKEFRHRKGYIDNLFAKTNNYVGQFRKEVAYRVNYKEEEIRFDDVVRSYTHLYDHAKSAVKIAQTFQGKIIEVYPELKEDVDNLLDIVDQLSYYVSQPMLEEKKALLEEIEKTLEDLKLRMQSIFFQKESQNDFSGIMESFTILYHVERFIAHMKDF